MSLEIDTLLEHIYSQPSYNSKILLSTCAIFMSAGVLTMTISLTVPIMKRQFDIEGALLFLLVSINQIGYMIGGLLTSLFMKKYVRKHLILAAMIISVGLAISMAIGPSLFLIYVLRFLIGVCNGIYLAQIPCIITECSSFEMRGFNFGVAFFVWPLGGLLPTWTFKHFSGQEALNVSYIIVTTLNSILVYFYLPESPKYLVEIGQHKKSRQALQFIKTLSKLGNQLTNQQSTILQQYISSQQQKQIIVESSMCSGFVSLFSPELYKLTLNVCFQWCVFFCIYNYLIFCLPEFLMGYYNDNKSSVQIVTYLNLISQSLSYLCGGKLLQIPMFGKKNTMIYCSIALFIICMILYLSDFLIIGLVICTFFTGVALTCVYPLTTQMYTIKHRLDIFSFSVIFNCFIPAVFIMIIGSIKDLKLETPFVYIAGIVVVAGYLLTKMPDDKSTIGLDEKMLEMGER